VKVLGLDGREYHWPPAGHVPLLSDGRPRSADHKRARLLLARLFPNDVRLEEVPLPGSGKLFCDFVLPNRRIVVEVNGPQHYEFVRHFHKTRLGFVQALARDRKKKEWSERNDLRLVEWPYFESDGEWERRILAGLGN
jgi:hypothetical protein